MELLVTAEGPPRRRGRRKNDPAKLTSAERVLLDRTQRIDRGEGCHAALSRLGTGLEPGDPAYCKSYTRRLVASLRKKGFLVFAGLTSGGTNVYLQPTRRSYKRDEVPICAGRPVPYGWSVERSAELFVDDVPKIIEPYLVDGYPVPSKVRQSYRPEVVQEAVRRIKETYANREGEIGNRTGLLVHMCKLVHQARKGTSNPAATAPAPAEPGPPRPADREQLRQLAAGSDPALRRLAEALLRDSGAAPPADAPPPSAPGEAPLTLAALLDMWRKSVELGIAPATRGAYEGKLANLRRLLGPRTAADLTLDELVVYVSDRQREGGVQPVTVGKELAILRRVLRYGVSRQLLPAGIDMRVPRCKARSAPRMRWLKVDEYHRLLAILPPDRADWVRVAVQTGARKGELARLRTSDVQWATGLLRIRGTKTEDSDRTVPLTDDVRAIAQRRGPGPLIVPWHNADRDLRHATRRLGIAPVSANDLRRTFCTWLLLQGMPEERVARLLGHTDTSLVYKVYGRIAGENMPEMVDHIRNMLGSGPKGRPN